MMKTRKKGERIRKDGTRMPPTPTPLRCDVVDGRTLTDRGAETRDKDVAVARAEVDRLMSRVGNWDEEECAS